MSVDHRESSVLTDRRRWVNRTSIGIGVSAAWFVVVLGQCRPTPGFARLLVGWNAFLRLSLVLSVVRFGTKIKPQAGAETAGAFGFGF